MPPRIENPIWLRSATAGERKALADLDALIASIKQELHSLSGQREFIVNRLKQRDRQRFKPRRAIRKPKEGG